MKTIAMIIGLCFLSISFGSNNPSIKNEMIEKVNPDLAGFEFEAVHENFVVVSFKVIQHHVEIIDIMGSSDVLIKALTEELINLKVDKLYPMDDIYNFKFIFIKQ